MIKEKRHTIKIGIDFYITIISNCILAATIAFVLIAMLEKGIQGEAPIGSFDEIPFNEGWTYESDGKTQIITLPYEVNFKDGQQCSISNLLPDDISDNMSLMIRASMEDVYVYINDELRAEYSSDSIKRKSYYIPSAYVVTKLNSSDSGQIIKIVIRFKALGKINDVKLSYGNDVWYSIFRNSLPVNLAAFIVLIMGIILSCIFTFYSSSQKKGFAAKHLGMLMIDVALWVFSESSIRQFIFPYASLSGIFAYLSVELTGVFAFMYFDEVQHRKHHKIYRIGECIMLTQILINLLLHFTNVIELYNTLVFSHIWLALAIFLVVVCVIKDIITKEVNKYKITAIGMIGFLVMSIAEIVGYYVARFHIFGAFVCIGLVLLMTFTVVQTLTDEIAMSLERERQQVAAELKLKEEMMLQQKKQSDEMTLLLIRSLSDTIEAKDEYTRGHSKRVSEYAGLIAEKMGLSDEDVSKIKYAATLHDIGKIGVPDTVLNKPSRLTDAEYRIIKTHSTIGADILQNIEMISYTADIARHHHERYDGKGYPDGLIGEECSIGARIVAVADSFDAMNSKRIYRNPLAREIIINEIVKNKGLQFDPKIADVFLELLESGAIDKLDNNEETNNEETNNDNTNGLEEATNMTAKNILSVVVDNIKNSNVNNSVDLLTGLMLRGAGEEAIASLMQERKGALIFCDMDNLKPINDRYGHKAGDRVLKILGGIIGKYGEMGVACRIGGDEFLLYLDNVVEKTVIETIESLISDFDNSIRHDAEIKMATLSIGACLSLPTDIYANILGKADKALYHVKQRGKAGYYIYHEEIDIAENDNHADIRQIIKSIKEAGSYDGALDVEYRQFAKMYDYLYKVCQRYEHSCNVVLVTLDSRYNKTTYIDNIEKHMHYMEMAIQSTIRTVDICTRYSSVQFLIVLLEAGEENVDLIMNRIFAAYYKMSAETDLIPRYEISTL